MAEIFFPVLSDLKVRSLDVDNRHIFWSVESSVQDLLDYEVQVERSESPGGPWEKVSPPFRDRYHFVDPSIPVGQRYRMLFYRVLYRHIPSGEERTYGPATQEPDPDKIALELRRQMQLLYREFIGRLCWLFPIRTFGPRCPACWSRTLGVSRRSRCITCFDTSFLRGYLSPIEVWISIDPSSNSQQPAPTGKQEQNNSTARMGYYPTIKPGDVLVEPENRRWRVISTVSTEQVRAPVGQELQIHEIPPRDIEMELPLDSAQNALRELVVSPPRNYTNPSNQLSDADRMTLLFPQLVRGRRGPP